MAQKSGLEELNSLLQSLQSFEVSMPSKSSDERTKTGTSQSAPPEGPAPVQKAQVEEPVIRKSKGPRGTTTYADLTSMIDDLSELKQVKKKRRNQHANKPERMHTEREDQEARFFSIHCGPDFADWCSFLRSSLSIFFFFLSFFLFLVESHQRFFLFVLVIEKDDSVEELKKPSGDSALKRSGTTSKEPPSTTTTTTSSSSDPAIENLLKEKEAILKKIAQFEKLKLNAAAREDYDNASEYKNQIQNLEVTLANKRNCNANDVPN
jgi:hypothetical protein